MEKNHKSVNGTNPTKEPNGKKIPIIQTLKTKKRLTKNDKEIIKAFEAVMDAIIRQQNAKV